MNLFYFILKFAIPSSVVNIVAVIELRLSPWTFET